jgi:sterol desaturase/sphingolipid hydroxylase (fatty acid hydroxylase superfamily)
MGLDQLILAHEPVLRLGAFLGVFAAMAAWELRAPRRAPSFSRRARWPANLALVVLNTVSIRVLLPGAAVGMAVFAEAQRWGVFNYVGVPAWTALAASVVALDLVIYLQHVMFHAVPALWRIHRMHHADLDIDVTTGARFHPIEIVLSMLIKFAAIAVLGAPAAAVVAFEVLLNASSMFNHANVRLPPGLDRWLRAAVVTPDMHRVHHSIEREETNSNFGFNLSLWDRAFGTYRAQPRAGHDAMAIGIPELREPAQCATLRGMLAIPFRGLERPSPSVLEPLHEGR